MIIFDLDGTLSDPLLGIVRCTNHALRGHGLPERSEAEIAPYVGPPLDVMFRGLTGDDDAARIAALVTTYRERYGEIGYAENTLYAGISEALCELAAAGHRLGVCTSKRADFARRVLEHFGLAPLFEFIDGGDIGVAKRSQLQRLRASGVVPADAWMIGDRAVDLRAAHANGLASAGVLWGYGSREELAAENPRRLFATPADMLAQLRTELGGKSRG